jgi:hypothetical protein
MVLFASLALSREAHVEQRDRPRCGLHFGILGLIIVMSAPYALAAAAIVWAFGWIFFLAAYLQTKQPV